jgi:hypothetical protein
MEEIKGKNYLQGEKEQLLLRREAHGLGFNPMIMTIFESDNQ